MRGCFLFVRIGLRLPRLRIGKCPTAFFVYTGFVKGRKPSFVINGKNKKICPLSPQSNRVICLRIPFLAASPYNQEIIRLDISYGILSFFYVFKPI